jgi:hypothetical protein
MSDISIKEIKYRLDLFNSRRMKGIVGVNLLSILNKLSTSLLQQLC